MSGDTVKLGDFGISKILKAHDDAAQTTVGTPYYMSPEILKVSFLILESFISKAILNAP
jgi:serine/threonine protein kinase